MKVDRIVQLERELHQLNQAVGTALAQRDQQIQKAIGDIAQSLERLVGAINGTSLAVAEIQEKMGLEVGPRFPEPCADEHGGMLCGLPKGHDCGHEHTRKP